MSRDEFYKIVKNEGLNKYNIGDSLEISRTANTIGCVNNNGWIVYETDERGAFHMLSKHDSEGEGLEALLVELRNKKRKEEIFKKLRKNRRQ